MLQFTTNSVEETQALAQKLAKEVYTGTNIVFFAEMGSGKTHFISAFLQARGLNAEGISSPTYGFVNRYDIETESFAHYDLYRLNESQTNIGVDEDFFDDSVTTLVEWAENLEVLPSPRMEVSLEKVSETERKITINFVDFTFSQTALETFIQHYKVPPHIQKHIDAVTSVALEVTDNLIKKGAILNREFIRQAALLHDVVRYVDFKGGLNRSKFNYEVSDETWKFWQSMAEKYQGHHHADVINTILSRKGFSQIGKCILAHKSKKIFTGFETSAEKILHYADKRCAHENIVSIEERMKDLQKRYGEFKPEQKYWDEALEKTLTLEKELLAQ